MTREARTILIVVVMALVALFTLSYIAQRYARILSEQGQAGYESLVLGSSRSSRATRRSTRPRRTIKRAT